jgi:predicted component of type VI protein secretion system
MRSVAGLGFVMMLVAGVARAQQSSRDCTIVGEDGKTVVWPDCKPPAGEKSHASETPADAASKNEVPASKKFPFPGEEPMVDPTAPPVAPAAVNAAPGASAPAAGDVKPVPPTAGGLQDAGSSGSSSSSSSSDSVSEPEGGSVGPLAEDDDEAAKEAAARKAARHKLPPIARQSPDEREQEDLKVASFYMDDKNFRGAYGRATDAVAMAGDDADAHFALAEAARKLGKLDEALANYKKCLTLDPVPKVKKAAEKAVKEMSGGGE